MMINIKNIIVILIIIVFNVLNLILMLMIENPYSGWKELIILATDSIAGLDNEDSLYPYDKHFEINKNYVSEYNQSNMYSLGVRQKILLIRKRI